MRAFISHHLGGIEEMCSKLERVEMDLTATQKAVADGTEILKLAERDKGAIRAEADRLKEEREAMEAEQENSQLKKEMDELRASLAAQKKETEELQAGLLA